MAIGGIPDILHDDNWATTPIIPQVRGQFTFYSILADGFVVTPHTDSTGPPDARKRRSPGFVPRDAPVQNMTDASSFGEEVEPGLPLVSDPVLQSGTAPELQPIVGIEPQPVTGLGLLDRRLPAADPRPAPDQEPHYSQPTEPQPVADDSAHKKIQMTIDSGATNMSVYPPSASPFPLPISTNNEQIPFHISGRLPRLSLLASGDLLCPNQYLQRRLYCYASKIRSRYRRYTFLRRPARLGDGFDWLVETRPDGS
jgi:hypothetical protein